MFDRLQRNKKIFHLLCSSVISIFLLQTLAWSAPAQTPSAPSAASIQIPVSEIIRNPAKLPIPSEYATLKEFHVGNNGKLIIHFQDAHSNYSGQMNMAKALETMMKQTGIDVVFVEGADQEVTLRETKKVTDQKTWGVAANRLLLQGIISGEEYLNLTSDLPVRLMGMEYQDLYDENLITYKDLIRHREAVGKYMSQIKTKVRSLKERLYTDELLKYEALQHAERDDDFRESFELLTNIGLQSGSQTLDAFPEMQKLQTLQQFEGRIDFDSANKDQQTLLSKLKDLGAGGEVDTFIQNSKKAASTQGSQVSRIAYLFALAESKGLNPESFGALNGYREYLNLFAELDLDRLLVEMDLYEDMVYRNILGEENARKVRVIDRYMSLLDKAFEVKLSSDDFRMLTVNRPDFDTAEWQGFLNEMILELQNFEDLIPFEDYIDRAYPDLNHFYQVVNNRDKAFLENTGRLMQELDVKSGFMIAGGYHTANLTKLMREQGYSYLVLTPVVEFETDHSQYEKVLLSGLAQVNQANQLKKPNGALTEASDSTLRKIGFVKLAPRAVNAWSIPSNALTAARLADEESGSRFQNERADPAVGLNLQAEQNADENLTPEIFGRTYDGQQLILGSRLSSAAMLQNEEMLEVLTRTAGTILEERGAETSIEMPDTENNGNFSAGTFTLVLRPNLKDGPDIKPYPSVFKLADNRRVTAQKKQMGETLSDAEIAEDLGDLAVTVNDYSSRISSELVAESIVAARKIEAGNIPENIRTEAEQKEYVLYEQSAVITLDEIYDLVIQSDNFQSVLERLKSFGIDPVNDWNVNSETWKSDIHNYLIRQNLQLFQKALKKGRLIIDPKLNNSGIEIGADSPKDVKSLDYSFAPRLTGTPEKPTFNGTENQINPDHPYINMGLILAGVPQIDLNDAKVLETVTPEYVDSLREVYQEQTALGDWSRLFSGFLKDLESWREARGIIRNWFKFNKVERAMRIRSVIQQLINFSNERIEGPEITPTSLLRSLYQIANQTSDEVQAEPSEPTDLQDTENGARLSLSRSSGEEKPLNLANTNLVFQVNSQNQRELVARVRGQEIRIDVTQDGKINSRGTLEFLDSITFQFHAVPVLYKIVRSNGKRYLAAFVDRGTGATPQSDLIQALQLDENIPVNGVQEETAGGNYLVPVLTSEDEMAVKNLKNERNPADWKYETPKKSPILNTNAFVIHTRENGQNAQPVLYLRQLRETVLIPLTVTEAGRYALPERLPDGTLISKGFSQSFGNTIQLRNPADPKTVTKTFELGALSLNGTDQSVYEPKISRAWLVAAAVSVATVLIFGLLWFAVLSRPEATAPESNTRDAVQTEKTEGIYSEAIPETPSAPQTLPNRRQSLGQTPDLLTPATGENIGRPAAFGETVYMQRLGESSAALISTGIYDGFTDGKWKRASGVEYIHQGEKTGDQHQYQMFIGPLRAGQSVDVPLALNESVSSQSAESLRTYGLRYDSRTRTATAERDIDSAETLNVTTDVWNKNTTFENTLSAEEVLQLLDVELSTVPESITTRLNELLSNNVNERGVEGVRDVLQLISEFVQYSRDVKLELKSGSMMEHLGNILDENGVIKCDCDVASDITVKLLRKLGYQAYVVRGFSGANRRGEVTSENLHAYVAVEIGGEIHTVNPVEVMKNAESRPGSQTASGTSIQLNEGPAINSEQSENSAIQDLILESFLNPKSENALPEIGSQKFVFSRVSEQDLYDLLDRAFDRAVLQTRDNLNEQRILFPDKQEIAVKVFASLKPELIRLQLAGIERDINRELQRRSDKVNRTLYPSPQFTIQGFGGIQKKPEISKNDLFTAETLVKPSPEDRSKLIQEASKRMRKLWTDAGWGESDNGQLSERQNRLIDSLIQESLSGIEPSEIQADPLSGIIPDDGTYTRNQVIKHLILEASGSAIRTDVDRLKTKQLQLFKDSVSGARLSAFDKDDLQSQYRVLRIATAEVLEEKLGAETASAFTLPESVEDVKNSEHGSYSLVIQPKGWKSTVFKLTDRDRLMQERLGVFGSGESVTELQRRLGSNIVVPFKDYSEKLDSLKTEDGNPIPQYDFYEQPLALNMFRLINRLQKYDDPEKIISLLNKANAPLDDWGSFSGEDWKAVPHVYMRNRQISIFSELLARGYFIQDPKEDNFGITVAKNTRKQFRIIDINMIHRITGSPQYPSFNENRLLRINPARSIILLKLIDFLLPMTWPSGYSSDHRKALSDMYRNHQELGDLSRLIAVIVSDPILHQAVEDKLREFQEERKRAEAGEIRPDYDPAAAPGQRLNEIFTLVNRSVTGDPITRESLVAGFYRPKELRQSKAGILNRFVSEIIREQAGRPLTPDESAGADIYTNQFVKYALKEDSESKISELLRAYDEDLLENDALDTILGLGFFAEAFIKIKLSGDRTLNEIISGARLSGEIPSGIQWETDEFGQADYREEAKLLLDDNPETAEIAVRNLEDALIQLNLTAGLTSFHYLGDAVNALVDAAQTAAENSDLLRADLAPLAANPSELIRRLQEAVEQEGVQNAGFLSDAEVTDSEDFRAALIRYFVALLFTINAADNSLMLRPTDKRELLMEYLDAALTEGEREADEADFELIDLEDPSESLEGAASTNKEFSSGGALSRIRREMNYQLGLFINLTGEFGDALAEALDRYEAANDTDAQAGEVSIQGFIRSLDSDPETLQRLNNAYSEIRSRWMGVRYSDFLNQTLFNPDSGKAARSARRFFGNTDRDYINKQIDKFLKDVGITSPAPYLHEVETAIASENVLKMAQRFNRAVLNDSRDYYAQQNISPISGYEQMGLTNRYITENENSTGFLRAVFRVSGSRMASDTDRKTPKQIQIILEQTKKFEQLFTDSDGELKSAYLDERFDFEKVIPAAERSKIQQAFRSLAAYEAPFKDEVDRVLKITDAEDRLRAIQTLERTYLPVDTEIATAAQIKRLNGLTPKMATALFQLYFSSGLDRGIVHAKIFYEQVLTPMDQHLNPEILENYLRLLNLIGQFKPDLINDNAYDTLFEAADRAESVVIERNYLKGTKKRILSGIQIARATAFKNRYRAAYDFARELEVEDELSDPVKLASLYFRFYKAYSKAELKKIFGDKVFEALPAPVQNPSLQQAQRINNQIESAITQSSERIGDPALSLKDAIKAIKAASSTDASVSQVFYRLAYGDEADPYPLGESYALTNVMRSLIYNGEFRKARQIAPVVVRVSVETDYFNDFWSAASVAEAEIIGRNGKGYQQRAMAALEQAIKLSAASRTELQSYLDLMEHLAVQLEDHYEERWAQTDTVELTDEDLAYQFLTQTFLPRLRAAADESAAPEPSEESSLGERLVRTSYKISGSSKFIRPMNLRFGGTVPGAYVGPSDYGLLSDFLTTPAEGLGGKALIEIDDFEEVNELINGFIKNNFNLKNFELIESDQHLLYDAPTIQSVSFMGSDLSKRGATSVVTQTFAGIGDCRYCNFFGQFALMSYVKIKRHQADAKLVRSILGESLNREQYEVKKQEWLRNDFHHLEVSVVDTYLSAAVQKDGPYSAAKVLVNGTAVTDIETQKDFYFIPGEEQKIEPHTLLHVIQRDKEKAIQAFEDGTNPLDVFDVIQNAYLNDFFYQRVYPLRGYRFIENGEVVGGIRTDDGTSGNLKLNDDGSIDLTIPNALRLLQDPASGAESRTDLHVQIIARSRSEGNRTNLPTTYDLLGTQGFYHHRSVNFPASTAKLLLSHVGNIDTPERQLQKKEHIRAQAALRYLVEAADSGPNELVQLQTSNIILGDSGSRLSSENVEELAGSLFEQVSALYPGKESYFLNSHFRKAQERAGQYLPEYYDAVLEEAGISAGDPSNQNTAKRFVFLDAGATPLLKPFQTYANVKYGIPEDRSVNLWATMGQLDAIWDKKNQIINLDLAAALLKYFDDSGVFGTPENDAEELVFVDTDSRWGKKVDSSPAGLGTEVLIYKLLFDEAVIRQAEKNYPKKDGYPGIHIPKAIKDQSNPKVKVVYISLNNVEQTDLNEELSEFYGIDPESYQRLNVMGVQGAEKLKDIDTMFIDMSPKLYATEPALFVENPSSPGRIIPKPKAATMQTPVMRERLVEHALQYFGYEISVLRQLAAEGLDVNDEIVSLAQRVKHRVQEIQKDLPQVILDPDNVSVDVSNLENFSIVRDVEDRLARYARTARQQPSSVKSFPQSQAPSSAGFVSDTSQLTLSQRDITSLLAVIGKPDYDPARDGDLSGIGSDQTDLSSFSKDPIGIDKESYDAQKDLRKVKLLTELTGRYADQALADILNASGYTKDEAEEIVNAETSSDVRNQFRAVIKDLFENIVDAYMQRVDRGLGAAYKSDGLFYAEKLNIEFKVERRPEGRGNLVRLSIAANGIDLDHDRLAARPENADLILGRLETSGDKLGQTQDASKDNAWRRLGGHNLGQSVVQSGLGRIPGFVSYSLKGRYEHPEFGGEYGSVSEITFDAASLNDEVTAARLSSYREIPKFEDVVVTDGDIIAAVSESVPLGVEDREAVVQHYTRVIQKIRNINQDMVQARKKILDLGITFTLSDVDKRTLPEVEKKLALFEIPEMIRSLVQVNGSTPSDPLRVLDIGTGAGVFLSDLTSAISPEIRDRVVLIGVESWPYAEREDGIDIRRGFFEYQTLESFDSQKFDLILGTEVLQYAFDRTDFVEHVTEFLKPGGLAVVGNSAEFTEEGSVQTVNSFNVSNQIGRLIIDQNSKPINEIKLIHLEMGARLASGQNQDSLRVRLNTGAFAARNIAVTEQLLAGVSDDIVGHAAKTSQRYSLNSETGAYVISAERTNQGFRLRGQSGDSIAEHVISRADAESSLSVPDLSLREPVSSLLSAGSRLAVQTGFSLFSSKRDPQILRVVQQFKRIRNQQDERMQLGELRLNLDGLITESMRQQAAETGIVPEEYLDLLNAWKSGVSFAETFGGHFSVSVLNTEDEVSQIFLQEALKAGFSPDINDPAKSVTYITPYLQTADGTEFDNGEGETVNVSNFAYRDTETGNPQGDIIANTNRVLITAAAINYRKSMKLSGQKEGFSRELSRALADVLYGKNSNPDRISDEDQLIEQASGENSHVYRRSLFENFLFTVQAIWSEIREQIISDQAAEWSA